MDVINTKMSMQDENLKRMEIKFDQIVKNRTFSIHNIEVQLGKLINVITIRSQVNLPYSTKTNPREQVKVITLRRGKVVNSKA